MNQLIVGEGWHSADMVLILELFAFQKTPHP
jgi:hypothetical protein